MPTHCKLPGKLSIGAGACSAVAGDCSHSRARRSGRLRTLGLPRAMLFKQSTAMYCVASVSIHREMRCWSARTASAAPAPHCLMGLTTCSSFRIYADLIAGYIQQLTTSLTSSIGPPRAHWHQMSRTHLGRSTGTCADNTSARSPSDQRQAHGKGHICCHDEHCTCCCKHSL